MEKNFNSQHIEAKWAEYWEQEKLFTPAEDGEPYSIVIPPPNVTGTLHMGHAFLNTIIDTIIRYQRMKGKNVLWQMGTDHAGIATQMVVERRLAAQGKDRRSMGRDKFLEEVWKWKEYSSGTIEKQLRRLGASVDWDSSRFTMDDEYIEAVLEAFVRLYEMGLIYRHKRLVNWDPVLQTAISDLEVRAEEESAILYYIRYPFVDENGKDISTNIGEDAKKGIKNYIVISTTRPETTLADGAVAVHPDDERFKDAVGKMVRVPGTQDRLIPIIADSYVKADFGSGCVKITPAHDFNDYEVGKRHAMETINIFTKDARLNENAPSKYRGLDRYAARMRVVEDFKQQGLLEKQEKHTYFPPRGDRSGVILEPYLTDQWFVKMDDLAERAIKLVEKGETKFVSPMWRKVYYNWLKDIQDWCISRQLWWGHRIPAWYDKNGNIYVGRSEKEVRHKNNINKGHELLQDEDVLDTWFSSSLWTFATMGWPKASKRQKTFNPTDLLVTGFDIIFFWVARMMMMTLCLKDEVPFHNVYIHGLVRDAEGQKMSKSKGNILDPLDIIDGVKLEELLRKRTTDMMQPDKAKKINETTKKHFPDGIGAHGTDALRFTFCAMASTGRDLNFDTSRCIGYRNFCNKLWNAARFVMMQCTEKEINDALTSDKYMALDGNSKDSNSKTAFINQWMQWRYEVSAAEITNALDSYRIDLAAQSLYELIWNEYCDWYIEFAKISLASENEDDKESVKFGLLQILDKILRLAHPFIPFITEEIWQNLHSSTRENKLRKRDVTKTYEVNIKNNTNHPAQANSSIASNPQQSNRNGKKPKSIMISPFPIQAQKNDAEIRSGREKFGVINWIKECVQGARNIRSEANIAPKLQLEFILATKDRQEELWLKEYADIIKPLCGCNKLSMIDGEDKPPAIIRLIGKGEILMPLNKNNQQCFNKETETNKLHKKIEAAQETISKLNAKISNKEFTNKAPAKIVAGVHQKLQENQAALKKMEEQLEGLA